MARVGSWNRELIDDENRLEDEQEELQEPRGIRLWFSENWWMLADVLTYAVIAIIVMSPFIAISEMLFGDIPHIERVEDYIEQEYPENMAVYADRVSGKEDTYFVAKDAQETVYVEVTADSKDIEDFTHTEQLVTEDTPALQGIEETSRNWQLENK